LDSLFHENDIAGEYFHIDENHVVNLYKYITIYRFIIGFLLTLFLAAGCLKRGGRRTDEVARVGDKVLTLHELCQSLEEMKLDTEDPELRGQYISIWVDHNLLLYEAKRLGYDKNPELKKQYQRLYEEMLINTMLEEAVTIDELDEVTITKYWRDHTGEFTRGNDAVKIVIVSNDDRATAWDVRNAMDKARKGTELIATYPDLNLDTTKWMDVNRLPEEIGQRVSTLRINDVCLPFTMNDRWYIIKLLNRAKTGEPRSVEEVAEDIRARLIGEQMTNKRIEFIAGLRREARRKGIVQISLPGVE